MNDETAREVLDVARGVLADLDAEAVLDRILEAAQRLTGATYAALGVLDESGTELARFLTRGIDEETRRRIGSLPKGRGVLGELIRDPRPLRLADVGEHPHSYGFPAAHPEMRAFLGVPIFIDGRAYGNLYLTDKQGVREFTDADQEAAMLLAEFAGLAIDHSRRFTTSESQREQLQRTVDALDATVTIARTLAAQTELDPILELVAKRGRALVSARALVIELEAGSSLEVVAAAGKVPAGLIGQRLDLEDSVAGAALRTLRSQRLEDAVNRARYADYGLGGLGLEAEAGLVVPLVLRGHSYGALVALDRLSEGPAFSAQDQELLEAFAASAATAVATAKFVDSARRRERLAAVESERGRWARELHDETLQGLAALRLSLAAMEKAEDREAVNEMLAEAATEVEGEIVKLRAIITDLRPAALDEMGIAPAIEALAERMQGAGLRVDLRVDLAFERGQAQSRHEMELETGVYRIAQEALNNTAKHANASRVTVEIADREDEEVVRITVRDDGDGFDSQATSGGFGLRGLRERAELLGGQLEVESTPGEGTEVRATLPARRRDADDSVVREIRRAG